MMSSKSSNFVVIAAVASGLVLATGAHAQRYSADPRPAPANTYKAQPQRSHKVKVAPNTHVTRRPPHRESQRALIEELQRRVHAKYKTTTRRKIVRDRPAVIEPHRVVVDSPPVIERRRVDYDSPRVIERRRVDYNPPRVIERRRAVYEPPRVIVRRPAVYEAPRVIERSRVVYEPPQVIERRRVVYDPPRVIERYGIVEDCPTRRGLFQPGAWLLSSQRCRCSCY
jgi:hypothetical protein